MHDSAERRSGVPRRSSATWSSIELPSRLKTKRAVALDDALDQALGAPSRRPARCADVDLELGAAQAGRDLERARGRPRRSISRSDLAISDSGMPNSRTRREANGSAPSRTARASGVSSAFGHIACSSRGGPGSTITVGPPSTGTTRPGAVPAGSIAAAPAGTIACLRFASRSASGSKRIRRANPAMIRRDLRLHLLVEHELAAGEATHDLGREVVGGRPEARRW